MKFTDIQKLHETGLITGEQRAKITAHFQLKENDGGKFLVILSALGAVLVAAGVILMISAHWNGIPTGVKIAAGLALMLGAHSAGWWLREVQGVYRRTGEALQSLGSVLFLANLALIGQVYHLDTRTPNIFLAWLAGIAVLPWFLRSKVQFFLLLIVLLVWFGCEVEERDSLIHIGDNAQLLAYSLFGLNVLGAGLLLRRTSFAGFAPVAEKLGLFVLLAGLYPLTWLGFSISSPASSLGMFLVAALAVAGVMLAGAGIFKLPVLNRQWKLTSTFALAGVAALLCAIYYLPLPDAPWYWLGSFTGTQAAVAIGLFAFCLFQIQTGLQLRSRFLVNLGIIFLGLDILNVYFRVIGTMGWTGTMFVVSGVFLILLGGYLEKKRRKLTRRIKSPNSEVTL